MPTPEPRITRSVDASAWSPPLPEASGFDHLVVETPGLRTHVAAIGEGEPVVLLHGFPAALVAVARHSSGHRRRRLPRPLPRPARGRLDRGRRSAYRTRDPAPRPARPLRRPPHRARPPRLPRHGRHHRDAADLRPPRAGSNGSATRGAAGLLQVQPEDPPGLPAPAPVHLAPPGRLTARSLLRGVRRPPDVGGSRRSPPRPDAPTRHRRRGASALPRHGPARSHAHDPRASTAAGGSRCRPSSYSAATTAPGPRSSWGVSAAIRSGTPIASSSPTSTTQRISSPTTPPPRSPTSRSTGSNEPHDGWLAHYSDVRSSSMSVHIGWLR